MLDGPITPMTSAEEDRLVRTVGPLPGDIVVIPATLYHTAREFRVDHLEVTLLGELLVHLAAPEVGFLRGRELEHYHDHVFYVRLHA